MLTLTLSEWDRAASTPGTRPAARHRRGAGRRVHLISGGNGPHEYRVHWHRGEPYAQTEEEHRHGRVDVEKWLTYYVGPRRPFTRVWALAASSPETRAGT